MEEGFRIRAGAVRALLADPSTAYVLVTTARPDAVAEASFFAEKLVERDIAPAALVVNRIHPRFGEASGSGGGADGDGNGAAGARSGPLAALEENLATLNEVARREEGAYVGLA